MATKKIMDWRVGCIAIICLTAYGIYSASQGINGHVMSLIVGLIALIVGVGIDPNKLLKRE